MDVVVLGEEREKCTLILRLRGLFVVNAAINRICFFLRICVLIPKPLVSYANYANRGRGSLSCTHC